MAEALMDYLANQNRNRNGEYLEYPDATEDMIARKQILATLPKVRITKVKVIHNNYLRGMFELMKMEYKSRYGSVEEKTLIHATSADNVDSIIEDNLDWRLVTRNKYGTGVSFSDDADYANCHSNRRNGSERAFFIASVLVSQTVEGEYGMEIPPDNADTSVSGNGRVYVKYSDNEFLLKYVVYYTAPNLYESQYY